MQQKSSHCSQYSCLWVFAYELKAFCAILTRNRKTIRSYLRDSRQCSQTRCNRQNVSPSVLLGDKAVGEATGYQGWSSDDYVTSHSYSDNLLYNIWPYLSPSLDLHPDSRFQLWKLGGSYILVWSSSVSCAFLAGLPASRNWVCRRCYEVTRLLVYKPPPRLPGSRKPTRNQGATDSSQLGSTDTATPASLSFVSTLGWLGSDGFKSATRLDV